MPRPAQSGRRLALEPVRGASDDLDPSGDEDNDVFAMDLGSLPAATTHAAVVLPSSAKRRGAKRQADGSEPAARPNRDRQPRSREC